MTKLLNCTVLLLAFCFAANSDAQTLSTADQKGVEACYHAFQSAFEKMDAAALEPLFTENAENISPMGEIVRGRAVLVAYFTNLFEFFKTLPKPDRSERKNLGWQTRYLAPDLVLSTYTQETTDYFGDKTNVGKNSFAVVLRKTGDKWLAELVTLTPVREMPAITGK